MPDTTMPDVPPTVQLSTPLSSTIKRHINRELRLPEVQRKGFTHPKHGHYLMLPPEFDVVFDSEPRYVTRVILEVMRQTIGWVGDGPNNRRLWAKISGGHFARKGTMDRDDANKALTTAVRKGYLQRRRAGRGYEYAVTWNDIEN